MLAPLGGVGRLAAALSLLAAAAFTGHRLMTAGAPPGPAPAPADHRAL
eukprot:COSAG04_NODE_15539_length_528_cov_5.240093_1_plen_47_part_10